jgi:molybdopterin-guanine dinucleotide biosynthesis protein A
MNGQPSLIAVVTAGGKPSEDDPLAAYTQGKPKSLIPIAGKPMLAHVVDALAGSRYVQHIVVVALDPAAQVSFSVPVECVPDTGDIFTNSEAGVRYAQSRYPDMDGILLSSCDVPTITPAITDAFVEECFLTDHDMYFTIVERSVMESRFPGSGRSYVHMREGDFAGGDLLLIRPSMTLSRPELWQEVAHARKSALRQARLVGLGVFVKLLMRRLTIAEGEKRVLEVFGVNGRAVPFPYAEVAMDVDKPYQLDIVRAELEARASQST